MLHWGVKQGDVYLAYAAKEIPLGRIYLNSKNPRHNPIDDEKDIIAHLSKEEKAVDLALSIARLGDINPLENVGVVQEGAGRAARYIAWEGNRRICALKMLRDPTLAPSLRDTNRIKRAIERADFTVPRKILAVVFDTSEEMMIWLEILHANHPMSRSGWSTRAQEKLLGEGAKYPVATAIYDLIDRLGYLTQAQLKKKFFVIERYTSIAKFRELFALEVVNDGVATRRSAEDFRSILHIFARDMVSKDKTINTRQNAPEIEPYADELISRANITATLGSPILLEEIEDDDTTQGPSGTGGSSSKQQSGSGTTNASSGSQAGKSDRKPSSKKKIDKSEALYDLIVERSQKLEAFYTSICKISAVEHPLVLYVAVWSFLESFASATSRRGESKFIQYFGKTRRANLGFKGGKEKEIGLALDRISQYGNLTKHSGVAGSFTGQQLINDMAVITPLLIAEMKVADKKPDEDGTDGA